MREFVVNFFSEATESLAPPLYRISAYLLLSMFDEPAILALGFC